MRRWVDEVELPSTLREEGKEKFRICICRCSLEHKPRILFFFLGILAGGNHFQTIPTLTHLFSQIDSSTEHVTLWAMGESQSESTTEKHGAAHPSGKERDQIKNKSARSWGQSINCQRGRAYKKTCAILLTLSHKFSSPRAIAET